MLLAQQVRRDRIFLLAVKSHMPVAKLMKDRNSLLNLQCSFAIG